MNDTTILVSASSHKLVGSCDPLFQVRVTTVIDAKDGQEAVEMVIRERPALIFSDVNMPGMSGLETSSKIRLSFNGPIIMVTVRNSEKGKILALDRRG